MGNSIRTDHIYMGRETDLNRSYIVRALQRYEEMTGNIVEMTAVPPEDLEEKGIEALRNKESELDILLYFGGTNLDAFDPDKNFYDFSDSPWVGDLTDVSINQAIYHGKVIGLPHWEASVSGTFYNKKIFQNDWNGMSDALSSGKYAMMLCWDTWLYTDFKGNAADFGLMPAFIGVPENGTFEGPNLSLFLVNKNGSQVDAALDLISFLADPYNYNPAFEGVYTAPVFKKQMASISTPQYVEASRWIEENYNDSEAWLNIRGFSQSDAVCILDCMSDEAYTVEKCLEDMDTLRRGRTYLRPQNQDKEGSGNEKNGQR